MINDKLIEKIRKLLALAADQSNAHVSAEALRKAQELMAEAGVTEEILERATIKKGTAKSPFSVSRIKLYEQILVNGIAKAFACEWIWGQNHSGYKDNSAKVHFYGPQSRMVLAVYAYEVLVRQLQRARSTYVQAQTKELLAKACERAEEAGMDRAYGELLYDSPDVKAARRKKLQQLGDAFCVGFVTEVQKQVVALAIGDVERALIKSVQAEDVDGEVKPQQRPMNADAFYHGVDAAKDAHLHRPMEGGSAPVSLLGQTLALGHG